MEISEKICLLRKKYNLSQRQLGNKIGVSDKVISRWENGISLPTIKDIKSLAYIFNISIDELCGKSNLSSKQNNNLVNLRYNISKKFLTTIILMIFSFLFLIIALLFQFHTNSSLGEYIGLGFAIVSISLFFISIIISLFYYLKIYNLNHNEIYMLFKSKLFIISLILLIVYLILILIVIIFLPQI